jgi:hypothetical protein
MTFRKHLEKIVEIRKRELLSRNVG